MLDKLIALNAKQCTFKTMKFKTTASEFCEKNLQIHGHNLHVENQGHEGGPDQLLEKHR